MAGTASLTLPADVGARWVRLHPAYAVLAPEELDERQARIVSGLAGPRQPAAVLVPDDSANLPWRTIDRPTLELLDGAGRRGARPRAIVPDGGPGELLPLLLDEVLEIETEAGWRSGIALWARWARGERRWSHPLAALSAQAVRHGQYLELAGPEPLAARLYFFHRLPVTTRWRRELADEAAVLDFLGLARLAPTPRSGGWRRSRRSLRNQGWISWHRGARRQRAEFKLYVSPRPERLPQVVETVLELVPSTVSSFKVGADAYGLLRPDKLVVFSPEREPLLELGRALAARHAGVGVHGVPFTCPIDRRGLCSWGRDPGGSERGYGLPRNQSWRGWVTGHLARALVLARRCPDLSSSAWRFALDRLAVAGVDTATWRPPAGREAWWT